MGNFLYLIRFSILEVSVSPPSSISPSPERKGYDSGGQDSPAGGWSPWILGPGWGDQFLDSDVDDMQGNEAAPGGEGEGDVFVRRPLGETEPVAKVTHPRSDHLVEGRSDPASVSHGS